MNRLVRGSVILAAVAVVGACGGLDTDEIDQTAELVADPSVVYVSNRDSQAVFVEALNSLGQQLTGDFTLTDVGPGIVVNLDTTFAPRPGVDDPPTRVRYFVKAASVTTFVSSTFTVSANGESVVIPVRITPDTLASTVLSNANPALGDTIQLTAPAGIKFTSATDITFPGDTAKRAANVGVSADSSILYILAGPGITAQAIRLGDVQVAFHPGVEFDINTDAVLTTPAIVTNLATVSNSTPATGDTVVLSVPLPYKLSSNSVVTLTGAGRAQLAISPDSSSVSFVIGPNSSGIASVSNVTIAGVPSIGLFTFTTAGPVTTPALTSIPASFAPSNTSPNTPIVVTAPGFKFLPTATATVGGLPAAVIGPTADSSSISIVPFPGTSGVVTFNNVVLSFLTTVPITNIPSVNTVTVSGALTPLTNTDDPFAAQTIALGATGETVVYDVGSFGSPDIIGGGGDIQFIRFSIPVARTLKITVNWNNASDIDFYLADGGFNNFVGSTSASATGAQPETQTVAALPAGTYILMLVNFADGPIPPFVQIHFE
jgi:hypothetical protein